MRALTLHQPWAWSIVHGPKRVENRSWPPPLYMLGQRFAIHAGKTWDEDGARFLAENGVAVGAREDHHFGAIVGVATLRTWSSLPGHFPADQDRFFFGPVGWLLENVRAVAPIPRRGYQQLWQLPREVERLLLPALDLRR